MSFSQISLPRFSVESSVSLIIAIVLAAVPMTWWLRLIFMLVCFILITDVALNSPKTTGPERKWKAIIASIAIIAIGAMFAPPIWNDFHKAYPTISFRNPVILNEESEPIGNAQLQHEINVEFVKLHEQYASRLGHPVDESAISIFDAAAEAFHENATIIWIGNLYKTYYIPSTENPKNAKKLAAFVEDTAENDTYDWHNYCFLIAKFSPPQKISSLHLAGLHVDGQAIKINGAGSDGGCGILNMKRESSAFKGSRTE